MCKIMVLWVRLSIAFRCTDFCTGLLAIIAGHVSVSTHVIRISSEIFSICSRTTVGCPLVAERNYSCPLSRLNAISSIPHHHYRRQICDTHAIKKPMTGCVLANDYSNLVYENFKLKILATTSTEWLLFWFGASHHACTVVHTQHMFCLCDSLWSRCVMWYRVLHPSHKISHGWLTIIKGILYNNT